MPYCIDITDPVEPRRRYRSPRRDQQRLATRAAVRDAARELFVQRGYVATSVAAVADAADVAPETVYATFGSKARLLAAVARETTTGADEGEGVLDADWFDRLRAETDPRRRLDLMTEATRPILARAEPVATVVRAAAASDSEIAELWAAMEAERLADVQALVALIAEVGPLPVPVDRAVDLVWALSRSTDLYRALTAERGWSEDEAFEAVTDLVERTLLG
jgi:AcrR family transcriptional regulator